ncbi:sensor histidine kinase [Ktedonosporobacter rubrisoli]|nr:HAMP domain-containing sensor histidine kinase [Ktedonosporobacter rubrisoli]
MHDLILQKVSHTCHAIITKGLNLCNLITWPWPRKLLYLAFPLRLGMCLLCFPLCVFIYLWYLPTAYSILLTLPMGLASWLFSKRGACACFFGYLSIQIMYNLFLFGRELWPPTSVFSLLSNAAVLFVEGSAMVSLRYLLSAEEQARLRAEQGEQQAALAYEQQRQLYQLKSQFILNVNHELRTPLTAASGYLEMLQLLLEENGHLERTKHGEYLNSALRYCEELQALVNNVLQTIEIGSDRTPLKLEQLAVAETVHEVLERFDIFRRHRCRIHLDIAEHLYIWANAQCLHHVLYNLISNAIKYAPEVAPIVIGAWQRHDTPQFVCIYVRDYGPGIPHEELPLLFGQFVRLQRDLAGTVRGTGLGLYISKHLIEAMGGQIWVESTGVPEEGSVFFFTLRNAFPQVLKERIPLTGAYDKT